MITDLPACIEHAASVQTSAKTNMTDILLPPWADSEASIVLLGNRGAGTSTLALILSNHIRWNVVNATDVFYHNTGSSRAGFQEEHGALKYRQQNSGSVRRLLHEHDRNHIIVCDSACLDGDGPQLLREYSTAHTVVHIVRDKACIQEYLGKGPDPHFAALIEYTDRLISSCTNCEFFNLSQNQQNVVYSPILDAAMSSSRPPSLILEKVAHDFLHFVGRITKGSIAALPRADRAFPLQPEDRLYSYVFPIRLSAFDSAKISMNELESGADVIELIMDVPDDGQEQQAAWAMRAKAVASQKLASLRRHCESPIIFHVGFPSGSLFSQGTLAIYLLLLHHGLRLGCEYVSIDMRLSDKIISQTISDKGNTKIAAHFFDTTPTINAWRSSDRREIYSRAQRLGCDLVRLVQLTRTREDNFDVQEFSHYVNTLPRPRPVIVAYNVGPSGRTSRIFNRSLSPITLPNMVSDLSGLTARDAQRALFGAFILDSLHFHVVGADISYSLVPSMFRAAFEVFGMPHTFGLLPSSSLAGLARQIKEDSFGGATFPPPFKTDIVPLLDILSPSASIIGAVNILIPLRYRPDLLGSGTLDARHEPSRAGPIKALYGDNTDWIGIKLCIQRSLSPANCIKPSTTALVVGAGGTARAAVFAMLKLGVSNIFIMNRTPGRAHALADDMNGGLRRKLSGATREACDPYGTVHVLQSEDNQWPTSHDKPTIIVSCVEVGANVHVPTTWTNTRTGGVFVQVGENCDLC